MDKTNTQAIIIDLQEKALSAIPKQGRLRSDIKKLIKAMNILNIPITMTTHTAADDGEPPECISKLVGSAPIDKNTFSCVKSKDILQKITDTNHKNVILCGIESHICVYRSAKDLKACGFSPVVVSDCIASRKKSDHKAAMRLFAESKIPTPTLEMLVFLLLEGTFCPEFKELMKILRA